MVENQLYLELSYETIALGHSKCTALVPFRKKKIMHIQYIHFINISYRMSKIKKVLIGNNFHKDKGFFSSKNFNNMINKCLHSCRESKLFLLIVF